MSNYTASSGLAFKTFWGAGTFIRTVSKIGLWGLAGLFWGLVFFEADWPLVIFHYITITIFIVEICTLFAHFINNIISMFMDH